MTQKHEWFTESCYADHATLIEQLTAIEDDGREVFTVFATPYSAVIVSRRPRPASATPTPEDTGWTPGDPPQAAVGGGSR